MNAETDLKVGDVVTVIGNALFPDMNFQSKILSIDHYPSLWLPPGEKRWGATFEATSLDENDQPMVYESSPMLADQFSWTEDGGWQIQLY